jgi:hypothetical protein
MQCEAPHDPWSKIIGQQMIQPLVMFLPRLIYFSVVPAGIANKPKPAPKEIVETDVVVDWVKAQNKLRGKPKVREVMDKFNLPQTTAQRRIRTALDTRTA